MDANERELILKDEVFAGTIPKDSMRTDLPTNSKKSELLQEMEQQAKELDLEGVSA